MKLPLRLVTSIFFTSVCASGWPYREIVNAGKSVPVLLAPVYGAAPAVGLLPTEEVGEVKTIVSGPVTGTTIVEGSSSGPVTILTSGSQINIPGDSSSSLPEANDSLPVSKNSVLVRGPTAGPVTLVAPSDNSIVILDANNTASVEQEGKNSTARIENAEESSSTEAQTNATAIRETIGLVTANAVIGPSTGPIIIAGPTAPPLPIPATATTLEPITTDSSPVTSPTTLATSSVTKVQLPSVSNATSEEPIDDGPKLDTSNSTKIEISVTSSSSEMSNSGNFSSSNAEGVGLYTPSTATVFIEAPLGNVVVSEATAPSVIVSGPPVTDLARSVSPLLLRTPLYSSY